MGGTGYLGCAVVSELLKYAPKNIFVLSRDEVKHFNFSKEFNNNSLIKNIIGDIRDYACLLKNTRNIDIVFHVAALKRMDALEDNVEESIKTNILGSLNVFYACVANNVKRVIFVSTDKACSPINTYGASKFVSEKIFTNYDTKTIDTIFTVVRFGNIIESTGSVIPIFTEKIQKGQDLTLTDPAMTRFIINKNEAVELIFETLKYSVGGEIFVRKIPSMKITDLIDVLKKRYHATNLVKNIGLRPGEKIHEVLINDSEMARTFEFEGKYIIVPNIKSWLSNLQEKNSVPAYVIHGQIKPCVQNYSSDCMVISQDVLNNYLQNFWVGA